MVWRYGTPTNLQIIPKWRVVAVYRVWGLLVQGLNCPRLAKRIFFLSLIHAWYLISYQVPKFIPHTCRGCHGRCPWRKFRWCGEMSDMIYDVIWYNHKNIFKRLRMYFFISNLDHWQQQRWLWQTALWCFAGSRSSNWVDICCSCTWCVS